MHEQSALAPEAVGIQTIEIIKDYYRQDMACLAHFNYSWSAVEKPMWHLENITHSVLEAEKSAAAQGIVNTRKARPLDAIAAALNSRLQQQGRRDMVNSGDFTEARHGRGGRRSSFGKRRGSRRVFNSAIGSLNPQIDRADILIERSRRQEGLVMGRRSEDESGEESTFSGYKLFEERRMAQKGLGVRHDRWGTPRGEGSGEGGEQGRAER